MKMKPNQNKTMKPNQNKTNARKEVLGYLTKKMKKWEEEISEMGLRQRGGDFLAAAVAYHVPVRYDFSGRNVIFRLGNLVLKDFDIRKEAGGASFVAVQKEHNNVQVSENYLEIHLFWAGKGTCCVPAQGTYGPSISAISATPELLGIDAKTFTFSYAELKTTTEDFNPDNKLGEGGFGPVYKGTLNDGRVIAVKQLSVTSHQGKNQFLTEIATISAVQHRNLVKLYGCCIEGDKRLLVYEYLENKSLDQALFGKRTLNLDWSTRFNICLGVARGLVYLHEESRLRIVHRDVKASNILLDSDLIPKISDFGLAKLYDDKKTHISTRVAGTIGYLAPEYAMRGHLTEKADVFAFGVVALELVSGRPNSDSSLEEEKIYILEWAWQLHENNREVDLVDSKLSEFNEEEVKRLIGVSLLCTQASPTLRPSMSRVVAMLSGDIEVSTVTSRPGYLTNWKFDDITNVIGKGATDISYFNSSTASTSIVGDVGNSPANASKPMIGDAIKQGR
uniref:non-specific serine/threonine protein kinase n=1 Tax=Quercus lobata TaxID=97700 RepID=A0A7N2N0T6_QUELO